MDRCPSLNALTSNDMTMVEPAAEIVANAIRMMLILLRSGGSIVTSVEREPYGTATMLATVVQARWAMMTNHSLDACESQSPIGAQSAAIAGGTRTAPMKIQGRRRPNRVRVRSVIRPMSGWLRASHSLETRMVSPARPGGSPRMSVR